MAQHYLNCACKLCTGLLSQIEYRRDLISRADRRNTAVGGTQVMSPTVAAKYVRTVTNGLGDDRHTPFGLTIDRAVNQRLRDRLLLVAVTVGFLVLMAAMPFITDMARYGR
mgnify:CR=1 FL=1